MKGNTIQLHSLKKEYKKNVIFKDVNLLIHPGEIISIVGPSGTGKSTLLKCIAGLESVSSGKVIINDKDFTNLPANKRPIVMMFQQALLFPHMTIRENIEYGLLFTNMKIDERMHKVNEYIKKVDLHSYSEHYPHELSGGQKQRASLARALILEPELLLLDEPFSSLDKQLRQQLREWVKTLLMEQGVTTLFVTHDTEEAMIMGDKVAVFAEGGIQQIGVPHDVYHYPKNESVAKYFSEGLLIDSNHFVPIRKLMANSEGDFHLSFEGIVTNTFYKYGKQYVTVFLQDLNTSITLLCDEKQQYTLRMRLLVGVRHSTDIVHFKEKRGRE
ncbi:ABC transporter ATP-binding protein [Bacillus sp. DJP31]|uniref:ABC transporter ATP-binding protein n=1 Tax=Bacillus sp. DJP31 TaxID=3409789 RepID=UPI003BB621A8